MKRFLRLVSLTLLIMSTSGNTFAEEKVNVARQGTIRGRIVDTSKQILPGASIYIEKLQRLLYIRQSHTGHIHRESQLRRLLSRRNENHHSGRKDTRKGRRTQ